MKTLVNTTDYIKRLWFTLPDSVRRMIHTFYQAFLGVFLMGITDVISNLLQTGNFSTSKTALVALVSAAVAAAISAVKSSIVRG